MVPIYPFGSAKVADNEGAMLAVPLLATWFLIQSPHFELATDTDEKSGRQVLAELENVRLALAGPYGTPLPVRCFLFRRGADFAAYRPTPITRALFQSGPDRDYIVATLTADGKVPRENLIHEYVHLYLHHTTRALPKWADEGLAEYYSTIRFSPGSAEVGLPISRHRAVLARSNWMNPAEMATVTPNAPEYSDAASAEQFYAQAWAAIYAYASAHQGRPPLRAEQFSTEHLSAYLKQYQGSLRPPVFRWPMDQISPVAKASSMDETAAALLQVDLLLRLSKHEAAQGLLEDLERRAPRSAIIERGLALIAAERGDNIQAVQHFERALTSPDADADSFFEYAVYLENLGNHRDRVAALLAEATTRNPNHAEAQFLQGRTLARIGRHSEAIAYFERAARILPREPLFTAAVDASKESLRSKPDAKTALDVSTPDSWKMPAADAKLAGTLERVDCSPEFAQLQIRAEGTTRTFQVRSSDRIQIRGSTGAQVELACGAQRDRPKVEIELAGQSGLVAAITFLTQ
jgi:tetratricopeptide (TPR) repeat protein